MKLVLFDLDNTLLAGDSDHSWGQFLVDKGVLDREIQQTRNDAFFADYQAGTLDINAFLEFQLAPLARYPRAQLDAWHDEFLAEVIRPLITPLARTLVQQHLDQGALVAVVTATNAFVTAPIVREFGIPHLIATIPAQENGRFTGEVRGTPAFQAGKIDRVNAWLESLALNHDCFSERWFYSDSHNDLPLLEKVDHPVAVDPDPTLREVAEARGWRIISLR